MATFKVTTTLKLEGTIVSQSEKVFNCPKQAVAFAIERKKEAEQLFPGMKFRDGSRGFIGKTDKQTIIVKLELVENDTEPLIEFLLFLLLLELAAELEAAAHQPQVVGLILIH